MPYSLLSKFCHFSGALVVLAVAVRGVEPTLRLNDVLARAAERNPALAALSYHERAAEALIEQAGQRPYPTLEIEAENFSGTGTRQGVRALEATVQASQPIERGGKREKRVAAASREREAAAQEYAVKRAEMLAAAAVAYVDTLAAQQRLALAAEPAQLAQEVLTAAEGRMRVGMASATEPARARALLATAQGEFARAQSELAAARARLAATWGGTADEVPALAGMLQLPESLSPATEGTLRDQLSAHPRLAHQQALIAARRAALDLERARSTQDIQVGGGVRFLREGSDAALVAGVSIPLVLRSRNQGAIRAARENLAGAEHAVRAVETELRAEFIAAWQQASAAHATATSLRRDALPAAQEAHAIVRRAYEQGQLPLIDVLDAQRELIALQREVLALEIQFAAAHARAEALVDPTLPLTAQLLSLP